METKKFELESVGTAVLKVSEVGCDDSPECFCDADNWATAIEARDAMESKSTDSKY